MSNKKVKKQKTTIGDSIVVKAITDLSDERYYLECKVQSLESKLETADITIASLEKNIAELAEYVQDLEGALAEAHLMSIEDSNA